MDTDKLLRKPQLVIGLYGVSGSGKSHALATIAKERVEWRCVEGKDVMFNVLRDQGLSWEAFSTLTDSEKIEIREKACQRIREHYQHGATIVSGHCSFPTTATTGEDPAVSFHDVFTVGDAETYNVILYLDKPSQTIYDQREIDRATSKRSRSCMSKQDIERWIDHEKGVLEQACLNNHIQFKVIGWDEHSDDSVIIDAIQKELIVPWATHFQQASELALVDVVDKLPESDLFLLIDADRTLTPQDTGRLFFEHAMQTGDPLKTVFSRYKDYSFQAFFEASLLYTSAMKDVSEYKKLSEKIGSYHVELYQAWKDFLYLQLPKGVHAIVVTCSNYEIWQAVVGNLNRSKDAGGDITVVAGNHLGLHSYIVDDKAKAILARELRKRFCGCQIFCFGDSALDVPMMHEADRAYIVADPATRNRSMQDFISKVKSGQMKKSLYQIIGMTGANSDTRELFYHIGLSVADLPSLRKEIACGSWNHLLSCTPYSTAASILALQSRRADFHGPYLIEVHVQIGRYLADQLLDRYSHSGIGSTSLVQWEQGYRHVQGTSFGGLTACENVVILPLMRGGEPMARGIHEKFPRGRLVHYWETKNDEKEVGTITSTDLSFLVTMFASKETPLLHVIVVDSVINSGKSIQRVLANMPAASRICVHVVASVIQSRAAFELPLRYPRVRFLALRVSENEYTGQGGTDTGNRLFGTL